MTNHNTAGEELQQHLQQQLQQHGRAEARSGRQKAVCSSSLSPRRTSECCGALLYTVVGTSVLVGVNSNLASLNEIVHVFMR
ncbi:hypothetical protein O3P69_019096 [Scylla paramamosain]|uniref:Uncharacterized protein n=1 Tax=Scylla paramamosain TaxID=85552 RepID=A0AAW0SAZ3_SCYPA